ncbi:hypothetical protein AOLI_G00248380 [Acnodon oligacanthus]
MNKHLGTVSPPFSSSGDSSWLCGEECSLVKSSEKQDTPFSELPFIQIEHFSRACFKNISDKASNKGVHIDRPR